MDIVILPGWGLSGEKFLPLEKEFVTHGYRVYSVDFPGCGRSALPDKPLTLSDYVEFLDTYIQKRNIRDFSIIAHSFGGRVALQYLLTKKNSVRTLILSGTPGFSSVNKVKFFAFVVLAKIGNFLSSVVFPEETVHKIRLWYYKTVGARDFYRAEGVMRQTFKNVVNQSLLPAMQAVSIPTLLIWGSRDTIVPVSVAKRMNAVIRGSRLTIVDGQDHRIPFADPKEFYRQCKTFISSL